MCITPGKFVRRNTVLAILVCFLGVVSYGQAFGQNIERYRPLELTPPSVQIPEIDREKLDAVTGDDKVLVEQLEAVIIVDHQDKVSKETEIDDLLGVHHRFEATDSLVYGAGVQQIIGRYLGQPITLRNLNQMARDIILHYRDCKQPIVDVAIPEQRITGGTVHVVVTETRIDRIVVQPGCYFDCCELSRWIRCTQTGDRIYEPKLESDLFWLNQNPFRKVTLDFQPGANSGTTDVIFKSCDVRPLRGYIGLDDTGVPSLNYGRYFGGFQYGNLFHRGGTLGYQYTTDEQFNRLNAHAVSINQPLSREASLYAYGSWAGVTPRLGLGLAQDGESWQLGTGWVRHLIRNPCQSRNFTLGLDFKSTNNNLEFAGTTIANSNADLVQFKIGFEDFQRFDQNNYSLFRLDTFVGPGGGMTGSHSAAAFSTIRPDTSPDYIYARLMYERTDAGGAWQLLSRFTGQVASERLLFSETLGLGGFDTIRGFDQRAFNADHGWIANFELGPCTRRWGCSHNPHTLRPFVFFDLGNGYVQEPQLNEDSYTLAAATGVGFRYQMSDRLIARFDYGYGIRDIGATARDHRGHFSVTWIPGPRPY